MKNGKYISIERVIESFLRYSATHHSIKTRDSYESILKQFKGFLDVDNFYDIDVLHIEEFLLHIKNTPYVRHGKEYMRKPSTVLAMHNTLRSLYTWCEKRDLVAESIMAKIDRPKANEEPHRPISAEQVKLLLNCALEKDGHSRKKIRTGKGRNLRSQGRRDQALLALMIESMLRAQELINLRLENIEFQRDGGFVRVELGKGKKSRVVPFGHLCAEILDQHLLHNNPKPREALFSSRWGTPFTYQGIYRLVISAGERAGIEKLNPHRLRTTGACLAAERGVPAYLLQNWMGHTNIKTTMGYIRYANINTPEARRRYSPLSGQG